jgi:hypothetical protein
VQQCGRSGAAVGVVGVPVIGMIPLPLARPDGFGVLPRKNVGGPLLRLP